ASGSVPGGRPRRRGSGPPRRVPWARPDRVRRMAAPHRRSDRAAVTRGGAGGDRARWRRPASVDDRGAVTVLAFDTATPATTVALSGVGDVVFTARHDPVPGERPGHATHLLGLVERVMTRAEVGWEGVDRIAVGVGPGTFTGLRIGIATARALARA